MSSVITKEISDLMSKACNSLEDMRKFFEALYNAGINYNPDDDFNTYVDHHGAPTFRQIEADALTVVTEQLFQKFGDAVYSVALKAISDAPLNARFNAV